MNIQDTIYCCYEWHDGYPLIESELLRLMSERADLSVEHSQIAALALMKVCRLREASAKCLRDVKRRNARMFTLSQIVLSKPTDKQRLKACHRMLNRQVNKIEQDEERMCVLAIRAASHLLRVRNT